MSSIDRANGGLPNSLLARRRREGILAEFLYKKFYRSDRLAIGVTLTCKEALPNDAGGLAKLTREELSKQIGRYIFNRLDRAVYKNAVWRFEKRLRRISAIEGGGNTGERLHAHILIEYPQPGRSMSNRVQP